MSLRISVEIMALRIRNNKNIKGFQVKIDHRSFLGFIMNKDKTEGLWVGKLEHCKVKVCVCGVLNGKKN